MEVSVRDQMRARYSLLAAQIEHPGTNPAELGTAYGELGELLMAATYFDAAEACYLNAEALAPADVRWPYFLGQLYKAKSARLSPVACMYAAPCSSVAELRL